MVESSRRASARGLAVRHVASTLAGRASARGLGATLFASALVVGCKTHSTDSWPLYDEDPFAPLNLQGEESAMQASGSCEFTFTPPPAVEPGGGAEGDSACSCTRRQAGQVEPTACLPGVDWGVTATIGPEGGNVALRNTPSTEHVFVLLEIPPNALAEPTTIRIIETSLPPPADSVDNSPVYVFEPVGLTFAAPVAIKIPMTSENASFGGPTHTIYWSKEGDPCALEPLADNYENAGFNQGTVRQFGWAFVGNRKGKAMSTCP